MSRSGYCDDIDSWALIRWRGAVKQAIKGKRGQKMLRDLYNSLLALPEKKLISKELQSSTGEVCALGALGKCRNLDLTKIDPEDFEEVAKTFEVSEALAREIVYENDEGAWGQDPAARYEYMLKWVEKNLLHESLNSRA